MTINLTPVLQLVISVCIGLATRYLIPWLKAKAGQENATKLMRVAGIAVRAAEQMSKEFTSGPEKLNYALNYLKERGFDVSADELRVTVEAAVYEMNNAVMEHTDVIGFDVENVEDAEDDA